MNEPDRHANAFGTALLVHQARAIGGHDVLGTGPRVIGHLVKAHLRLDDFLEYREGAAESAALVGARRIDELNGFDLGQQVHWF